MLARVLDGPLACSSLQVFQLMRTQILREVLDEEPEVQGSQVLALHSRCQDLMQLQKVSIVS